MRMLKAMMIMVLALFVLIACSNNQNDEVYDDTVEKEIEDENMMEGDEEGNFAENYFSNITEVTDFVIEEDKFEEVYPKGDMPDSEFQLTWNISDASYTTTESNDDIIYISPNRETNNEYDYNIFKLNEANKVKRIGEIKAPNIDIVDGDYENILKEQEIRDNVLYSRYEYNRNDVEANPPVKSSTVQVLVTKCDFSGVLNNDETECEPETLYDEELIYTYDDNGLDERYDFGKLVDTSNGFVMVYAEDPDTKDDFLIKPLSEEQDNIEDVKLKDTYDIVQSSNYILYIDFDEGYYFVRDLEEDGVKRINIEDGEPLYEGADEKSFYLEDWFEDFISIKKDVNYILSDEKLYLINDELELIDEMPDFYAEEDINDALVYEPIYLGNGKILRMTEYEYQNKTRLKVELIGNNL